MSNHNGIPGYYIETEITFQCPVCLAIETLFVEEGQIVRTQHWRQVKGFVYHRNCGKHALPINMARRRMFVPPHTIFVILKKMQEKNEPIGHIASSIGVSRTTVKRWMLGKCYPNNSSIKKVSKYIKETVNQI